MNEYLECVIKVSKWTAVVIAIFFAGIGCFIAGRKVYELLISNYGYLTANIVATIVAIVVLVLFISFVIWADNACRRKYGNGGY